MVATYLLLWKQSPGLKPRVDVIGMYDWVTYLCGNIGTSSGSAFPDMPPLRSVTISAACKQQTTNNTYATNEPYINHPARNESPVEYMYKLWYKSQKTSVNYWNSSDVILKLRWNCSCENRLCKWIWTQNNTKHVLVRKKEQWLKLRKIEAHF